MTKPTAPKKKPAKELQSFKFNAIVNGVRSVLELKGVTANDAKTEYLKEHPHDSIFS